MGRALVTRRPPSVLDDPCAQPLGGEAQQSLVRDPVLEKLLDPAVIKAGEEVADVRVEHPAHLLPLDPDRQRVQRVMRSAPRSEPVGEAQEVLLVDGVEHLDHRPLEDLVLQGGDAKRPQPPVGLRDIRPASRSRPVAPAVDPLVQIPEVGLQVLPVGAPRLPIHPGGRPRVERPVGDPEPGNVDVMQQRREPCCLVLSCYFAHTVQPAWHA